MNIAGMMITATMGTTMRMRTREARVGAKAAGARAKAEAAATTDIESAPMIFAVAMKRMTIRVPMVITVAVGISTTMTIATIKPRRFTK